ncbi:MAG: Trk system potassium transporter TrkA [Clostridia bacterium]|nr:Trk system potassium transporter TrkA [Clostridia bacterium]
MNIIIVGCGRVGETLAEQLNGEGNNVTVVDVEPSRVNTISAKYDIMGVTGNGAMLSVLSEAGINNADLMIAVTGSDELNLLSCVVAKKIGNCHTVAQVKNPVYSSEIQYLQSELGISMVINPELAAAREISRVLRFPSALNIETFAKGKVEMLKFRVPEGCALDGMSVKDVIVDLKCDVLICTVERGNEAFIAKGDFVFREKDVVSMIASPKKAHHFFNKIRYSSGAVKTAMILGGGNITHYLCDELSNTGIGIKVIEDDMAMCDALADALPDITVINHDETDRDILLEEGLKTVGAFVALTEIDEENIFLSLFAKGVGCNKIVTKINRVDFDDVTQRLDLDSTIYPKNITADMIVRYVRAMKNAKGSNVETLYNVIKGEVEAAEFIIREGFTALNTPISQLSLKDNVLIASIIRNNKVIIPRGNDVILPGDAVVIVSKTLALHDITDILK